MTDLFNYKIVDEYNKKKFEGVINVNANIGYEMSVKNPAYDKDKAPDKPKHLYYFPIQIDKLTYLLPSEDLSMLPIKVFGTTKITIGNRGYERIDKAVSVKLAAKREMSYREYIETMLNYAHLESNEWMVWKIISDVAIRERIFIRAISYPSWGKTSTYYIWNALRNDIEIIDGATFAKMKHSLSVRPAALVLDEVDDVSGEERRFLSKIFRSCGDGRGMINNDSRASLGTTEVFDLRHTSIVALYNFPTQNSASFFEDKFHDKILDRLFPLLLSGGDKDTSPMQHKHITPLGGLSDQMKQKLDSYLRTNMYYQNNWLEELGDKKHWKPKYAISKKRWDQIYTTICNGLKLYAHSVEEFHKLESVLMGMHRNYLEYKQMYEQGQIDWVKPLKSRKATTLEDVEADIL